MLLQLITGACWKTISEDNAQLKQFVYEQKCTQETSICLRVCERETEILNEYFSMFERKVRFQRETILMKRRVRVLMNRS